MRSLLDAIGIALPDGLPHKEYAICDGPVTMVLDESGGINLVEYQGPRRTDGPRRGAFYSNGIWRRESFFPEPVISFELEIAGKSAAFDFKNLFLTPFGVFSKFSNNGIHFEYATWIRGNAVMFEWKATAAASVALRVREGFLKHHNEDDAKWEVPTFDKKFQALRYNLLRGFTMGATTKINTRHRHEACSMMVALSSAIHEEREGVRSLKATLKPDDPCRFVMVFGEDLREVEWIQRDAREQWEAWFSAQVSRYAEIESKTPRLEGRDLSPMFGEMIRVSPLFVESLRCVRNENQVGMRAATRGYGMWNGWDGTWASHVLNACGSDDTFPRYLNYLQASRGPNQAIPMTVDYDFGPIHDRNFRHPDMDRMLGDGYQIDHEMWGLAGLHQYYFRSGNRETLERLFPGYARSLRVICGNASEYGLVGSCFGGADRPSQCGRPEFEDPRENHTLTSRLCGVEDMAILYNGLTQGAELAAILGEDDLVEACAKVMERTEKNFLKLYFNEKEGFFNDAVWYKDDPKHRNPFFRITALLALYGYGEYLSLEVLDKLAEYTRSKFRHPSIGFCATPTDRRNQPIYERWKDNWMQNQTRESLKLARLAGDRQLLDLQLRELQRHYTKDRIIHENIFFAGPDSRYKIENLYMATSWWQGMTVYAWWMGIFDAVAGLRFERGPLEYIPGDGGRDVILSNLHWGGHRWSVNVTERGRWIRTMIVNGKLQEGSYQIRPEGERQEQMVEIAKTDDPPDHSVILSAGACPICEVKVSAGRLEATVKSSGFARVHFFSPNKLPIVKVNGERVDFRWVSSRSEGILTLVMKGDLKLEIDG